MAIPEDRFRFKCAKCTEKFVFKSSFEVHNIYFCKKVLDVKTHTLCPQCGKRLTRHALRKHTRDVHPGKKKYPLFTPILRDEKVADLELYDRLVALGDPGEKLFPRDDCLIAFDEKRLVANYIFHPSLKKPPNEAIAGAPCDFKLDRMMAPHCTLSAQDALCRKQDGFEMGHLFPFADSKSGLTSICCYQHINVNKYMMATLERQVYKLNEQYQIWMISGTHGGIIPAIDLTTNRNQMTTPDYVYRLYVAQDRISKKYEYDCFVFKNDSSVMGSTDLHRRTLDELINLTGYQFLNAITPVRFNIMNKINAHAIRKPQVQRRSIAALHIMDPGIATSRQQINSDCGSCLILRAEITSLKLRVTELESQLSQATSSGTSTPPLQASPSESSSSASFLLVPSTNGSLDNASAKKRWLRQAISEETDPLSVPSPNSRPSSPAGVECVAPLKKRRLARASMSSEVSNTPPSTPNNAEAGCNENEMDGDGETEGEREDGGSREEEEPHRGSSNRKWSCSEVSSAEEDMDDGDDIRTKDDRNEDGEAAKSGRGDTENEMENEDKASCAAAKDEESECFNKSPQRATTPRKSRWDQVDAPGPVLTSSNSNSPVKSSTTDAIVLDYVRNPEQYAKLTGVNAAPSGATALQFSSTPTLAERKREELGKRLSKSFGIRVPDVDVGSTEKQPTPTYISSSPRDVSLVDKQKLNGDIGGAYGRVGNVNQVGHSAPSLSPCLTGEQRMVPQRTQVTTLVATASETSEQTLPRPQTHHHQGLSSSEEYQWVI